MPTWFKVKKLKSLLILSVIIRQSRKMEQSGNRTELASGRSGKINCISPHSRKTGKRREGKCNAETMPNGF